MYFFLCLYKSYFAKLKKNKKILFVLLEQIYLTLAQEQGLFASIADILNL